MSRIRRILCAILALILIPTMSLTVIAADMETAKPYIKRMIGYYQHYQDQAQENIDDMLAQISAIDPSQGKTWQKIMDSWEWVNTEMPVYKDVLPDGLPGDDSMCIVVLGYGLNSNGSMKPELIDRLEVALRSAEKYPNAYVAVTGGETSGVSGVSEAGEMASWLLANGISENRLIVEKKSLSTAANAMNVYDILIASYPQVSSVAVVTSDYHIPWGCAMFTTVSHYNSGYKGTRELELVGNAACTTGSTVNTLYSQAQGISLIAGVEFGGSTAPALHVDDKAAAEETTQPEPQEEPEIEEADNSWLFFPTAMVALAGVILCIPTKK